MLYEWGWGQHFHFSSLAPGESWVNSAERQCHYIASRMMNISPKAKILDMGCGIGGPLRCIHLFTGASITGITISPYQVRRGNELLREWGIDKKCNIVYADYFKLPYGDDEFDCCMELEATVHASRIREKAYAEAYRVIKPGSLFVGYEWAMTDKYDAKNPDHVTYKKQIELGNSIAELPDFQTIEKALKAVGFEVLELRDFAINPPDWQPWYAHFVPSYFDITRIRYTPIGRIILHILLVLMEKLHLAPKGWVDSTWVMSAAWQGLWHAGEAGIFTPMLLHVCRKPLK